MRGGSLKRRLLLAFAGCFAALAAGIFLILVLLFDPRYFGVESAAVRLETSIERGAGGALAVSGRELDEVRRRSPGLWWIVRDLEGRTLSDGRVLEQDRQLVATLPAPQSSGEEILNYLAGDGLPATAQWAETDAGPVTLLLGGVRNSELPPSEWILLALTVGLTTTAPLLLLLAVLGFLVLPPVFRALERLRNAAAEVDGTDLDRRLPESRLVAELRPVARAFNAVLDRVQIAADRRHRLVADIAHELRTPLAVLSLRAEELPDIPEKPELRRGLDRLSLMVSQILDSERLGAPDRRREPVDLVELARTAVADIAPLAISEGYQLDFETEMETVVVQGDPPALGRAVSNLLSNAVAHAGGGGVITVRVTAVGAIEVEDQGPGLTPGACERVFEPFHRERWDKDGCGLGLHLVREVMRAHGGRAYAVESPSGALFRLAFPLTPAPGAA